MCCTYRVNRVYRLFFFIKRVHLLLICLDYFRFLIPHLELRSSQIHSAHFILCVTAGIKTTMAQNKVLRVVALNVKLPYSLSEIDKGVVLLRCSSLLQNSMFQRLFFIPIISPLGYKTLHLQHKPF